MSKETLTTDFEAEVFRLKMENKRLMGWLEHIYKMKDQPSINLREAASFAIQGDLI